MVRFPVWFAVLLLVGGHFLLHVGMGLANVAPDLLTIALLIAAREVKLGEAAGLGLIFGLFEDALSVLSFGANAVAMTLVGIFGSVTRDLFVGDSVFFLVSYFFIGKFLRHLIHWVMVGDAFRLPFVQGVLVNGSLAALYAAVVGGVVMAMVGLWRDVPR